MTLEHKRDAYGFAVRPQHLQRYREYADIYKEEEEERSEKWNIFLSRLAENVQESNGVSSVEERVLPITEINGEQEIGNINVKEGELQEKMAREHKILTWAPIRPSLCFIEQMMSLRLKRRKSVSTLVNSGRDDHIKMIDEGELSEGSEDEFYDVERTDPFQDASSDIINLDGKDINEEAFRPWMEELECLVHGGLPMALRGELWQAFVGARARRIEGYYDRLLADNIGAEESRRLEACFSAETDNKPRMTGGNDAEKWKGQIEKDLPRTFPGHPALDENGRNALRRLLTAYARHNPSVGYCQAMNFFAGLLLLLMPEENAFWALTAIIDDYFEGYFSVEMIECQVDQFVLEDLVRERFHKLVNHLDYLGVQIGWVTGPWFLSIFINMLPWESVLRVWDVLLFDGNRLMLFRTALALMELYGPALVTTKDAGDAITLLQSLAASTFDSSQLVLTACMGYQSINESRLQEYRNKHRQSVMTAMNERAKGFCDREDATSLTSRLLCKFNDYLCPLSSGESVLHGNIHILESSSNNSQDVFCHLTMDAEMDMLPDIKEQATSLKVEISKLLEEKRSATLRADELEAALMEMVKQDNRQQLSAKVRRLEREASELQQALSNKQEQELVMLEVLMRVEQEQKIEEDARISAEKEATAQKCAAHLLQEKYDEALTLLTEMEKRAVLAETMLEATLQYQSGQLKAQQSVPSSPRSPVSSVSPNSQDGFQDIPPRKISLLSKPFVLSWRDKNKGKPEEVLLDSKPASGGDP